MTIVILFGLENVMHAGSICHLNGELGKLFNKNKLKIDETQSEYSMLWTLVLPFVRLKWVEDHTMSNHWRQHVMTKPIMVVAREAE